MQNFTKIMKSLSDPIRVKILKMLQRKAMCVCEIQHALKTAQSTTSKHLKILESSGLIISKKNGLWVNYCIADGSSSPYAASLLGNLRHWLEDEPEIIELMNILPDINRENLVN
ncbi:MAG: winged helix-turn-helix transcriptional regulator [Desulfobacterales bacterium]|nr:winged helix-turn-helix transcriptional regulator [Desulfobacterales bacterium]